MCVAPRSRGPSPAVSPLGMTSLSISPMHTKGEAAHSSLGGHRITWCGLHTRFSTVRMRLQEADPTTDGLSLLPRQQLLSDFNWLCNRI